MAIPPHGFAVVGSFTSARRRARGEGVIAFRIDRGTGAWVQSGQLGGLENPSFLIPSPTHPVLYAAHGDGEMVSAIALDTETGRLRLLGQAAARGTNGVHLAVAPSGRHLVVANYATGTVAVLPIQVDGRLADATVSLELPGAAGPHRSEQTASHPHHVVFDPSGQYLLVPDKGLDRVFVLRWNGEQGVLALHGEAVMRPGAGPRHIAFHPSGSLAFVVNELESSVALCRWEAEFGRLVPVCLAPTLPPDYFAASTAAAIVVSACGQHVYASNRGHDSIAHFLVDAAARTLRPRGWTPSGGRDPRFMALDPAGCALFVANEQADGIEAFDIADGSLLPQGHAIAVRSPATIAFL